MMTEEERQFATLLAEGLDIRVLYGSAIEIADVRVRLMLHNLAPPSIALIRRGNR